MLSLEELTGRLAPYRFQLRPKAGGVERQQSRPILVDKMRLEGNARGGSLR